MGRRIRGEGLMLSAVLERLENAEFEGQRPRQDFRKEGASLVTMALFPPLSTPSKQASEQEMPEADTLRILVVGPELIAHALHSLLSSQTDMEVLPPLSDLKQTVAFVMRMRRKKSPVHVVLMDWRGDHELQLKTLSALSKHDQSCLVVISERCSYKLEQIKHAGARGYIFTSASPLSMATAIRRIAGAKHATYFPEVPVDQPAHGHSSNHAAARQLLFRRDRLDTCAKEIGWTLTGREIYLISNFARETDDIAADMHRQPALVRHTLSQRIYEFLRLLSGRPVHKRFIAFQVLLEYGILEYVPSR